MPPASVAINTTQPRCRGPPTIFDRRRWTLTIQPAKPTEADPFHCLLPVDPSDAGCLCLHSSAWRISPSLTPHPLTDSKLRYPNVEEIERCKFAFSVEFKTQLHCLLSPPPTQSRRSASSLLPSSTIDETRAPSLTRSDAALCHHH